MASASSVPSRCFIFSGPEKATGTDTCWSSAKPISSASGLLGEQAVSLVVPREVQPVGRHARKTSDRTLVRKIGGR